MPSYETSVSRIEVASSGDDVAIVALIGEHDLATKDAVWCELERVLDAGRSVVVDLSHAEFIDSSVLNNLVHARKLAEQRGRCVVLQLASEPAVRRTLEVSGLDRYFVIVGSRAEAIEAVRDSAPNSPA